MNTFHEILFNDTALVLEKFLELTALKVTKSSMRKQVFRKRSQGGPCRDQCISPLFLG